MEILRRDEPLDREIRDFLPDIMERYFRREDGKPGRRQYRARGKAMVTNPEIERA